MTKFLIIGLGNPGREYAFNRHNVGFMAVDRFAKAHKTAFTRRQGRALVTSVRLGETPVILAKPQTFMNLSGEAVKSLLKFYDVPLTQLLVCFDDIDLPVGAIRIRPEGGCRPKVVRCHGEPPCVGEGNDTRKLLLRGSAGNRKKPERPGS